MNTKSPLEGSLFSKSYLSSNAASWTPVDADIDPSSTSEQDKKDVPPFPWIERKPQSPKIVLPDHSADDLSSALNNVRLDSNVEAKTCLNEQAQFQPLQYHHERFLHGSAAPVVTPGQLPLATITDDRPSPSNERPELLSPHNFRPNTTSPRPDDGLRGRRNSPGVAGHLDIRSSSSQGRYSPDSRNYRQSTIDLQRLPYAQQSAPTMTFGQDSLQAAVGSNASLLSRKKTLEMYRDNVKKTNDPEVQYTFATFLVDTAQILLRTPDASLGHGSDDSPKIVHNMFNEARQILQRLADRSYPFAQYYLADGLANGVLNKGKEDDDKALPLFVAASKHGHAESAYRTALCYEYGWGTSKNPLKTAQYLRQAASKNHPGAMFRLAKACLTGDLGMVVKYREGIKWLKRAAESADVQYNAAPFELGVLHESGYGEDIFKDETYAAQLFTQSADLGHAEASFRLGEAYELGKLGCPRDPSLSVHFYNSAATLKHAGAMMAICAWYMVGAPPVLEKDESEAYEWARRAAEAGLAKAQYAFGYFTEMGIGCRRDPLESNVWYVRAADQGDQRAKTRLAAIQAVYSSNSNGSQEKSLQKRKTRTAPGTSQDDKEKKRWGLF